MATTTTVTVRFEVQETVLVDVEAELEVPAAIADDDEALHEWLNDHVNDWSSEVNTDDAHDISREVIDVYGTDA
ncbi:hypothetical protein AB0G73_10780 [Streptomyces sp. NPDC020719]|uniref:hypothetical protein n=1 Tax=Streptomyces sp. NPDC020719 TaxID=3154896 RepID=UPI003408D0D2